MAKYNIPKSNIEGLNQILAFDESSLLKFKAVIESISDSISSDIAAKNLSGQLEIETEVAKKAISAMLGIVNLSIRENSPNDVIINDIVESFAVVSEVGISKDDEDKLRSRLYLILGSEGSVSNLLKVKQLSRENQKNILSSRILTDIRPVFGKDLENNEKLDVLILHQLKIEFVEDFESKEIFVTLNSEKLRELKLVVERAITKEDFIKDNLNSIKVDFVS